MEHVRKNIIIHPEDRSDYVLHLIIQPEASKQSHHGIELLSNINEHQIIMTKQGTCVHMDNG